MLLIGATLARMDIKAVFTEWRIYPFSLIKQILIPLLLWFPLKWLVHDELILGISLIMISMPIANTAVLFATEYDLSLIQISTDRLGHRSACRP